MHRDSTDTSLGRLKCLVPSQTFSRVSSQEPHRKGMAGP